MTDTTPAVPDGCLVDAEGRYVPIASIKPEHLLEDEMVRALVARAEAVSAHLAGFRAIARDEIRAHLDLVAAEYGVERRKGKGKGNVGFTSYDGTLKVQLSIGEFLSFGPELQAAKALIDECLTDWTSDSRTELKTIVTDAFRVNKEGNLDPDRILSLRRYEFADERWKRAMSAISDSVRVTRSKEYLRFYRRPAPDRDFVQVPLDVAKV